MIRRRALLAATAIVPPAFPTVLREAQADRPWPALPPLGLIGEASIREAFTGDFQQLEELLRGELRKLFKTQGDDDPWPWVRAVFEDAVVVERDGKFWRYPYQADGTAVTLSTPTEVVQQYLPADASQMREAQTAGVFLEAEGSAGGRWLVRVIRAGLSGNGNFYPDAVLREAVELFEGARVFVKSDEEHIKGKGKDLRNLVGRLVEAKFVPGPKLDQGEVQATLELIEPEGVVGTKLREAHARGMAGLFGLSIDAAGPTRTKKQHGRNVRMVEAIQKVASVDLIVEPGAGGEIINLIEAQAAQGDDAMWRDRLIEAIRKAKPTLLKGKKVDELSDDDLQDLLREALAGDQVAGDTAAAAIADDAAGALREAMAELSRMNDVREHLREALDAAKLPKAAKDKLRKRFKGMQRFTEAEVDEAIEEERDYLAQFTESGAVLDLGEGRIEPGEGRDVKVRNMLDAFFNPDDRSVISIRECYVEITGDRRVTGYLRECNQAQLREALGSDSWSEVLGDSIRRRMIADYRVANRYDIWRQIVGTPVPLTDFRENKRTRYGGYGDLPIVEERDPYLGLNSPTDEASAYSARKRGGLETVTIEMIKNDDVGGVQSVPIKLSRSAKRTLAKFVLDFIRTNPVIYDGKALFHADHGNLGAAALDKTSLAAGRLAMLKQGELDTDDRIGISPKSVLVAADGEESANDLFNRSTNNDKTFIQSLVLDILPVWYWTDPNDWALVADPMECPTIEIGFMDGAEEPDIFVQDSPTGGSLFTHDQITYKIRHIYGGAVLDYRGMYKAVVAG